MPLAPMIVYDIGDDAHARINNTLLQMAHTNVGRLELRRFDSKGSAWLDGSVSGNNGAAGWKPMILREVAEQFGTAVWLDPGACVCVCVQACVDYNVALRSVLPPIVVRMRENIGAVLSSIIQSTIVNVCGNVCTSSLHVCTYT